MTNPASIFRRLRHCLPLTVAVPGVLVLLALQPANAQSFDMEKDRQPIASLDGLWRFQTGDSPDEGANGVNQVKSPAWANPAFDDSKWALAVPGKGGPVNGHNSYSGMSWYRAKVVLPPGRQDISLYVPAILTSYQIFADGRLVGAYGGMPPHENADRAVAQVYPLPQTASADAQPRTVTIAVRVWHWKPWATFRSGGLQPGMLIGDSKLIGDKNAAAIHERSWDQVSGIFLAMLETLSALASLAFFAFRPREREYFWFGITQLLSVAGRCLVIYSRFHPLGISFRDIAGILLNVGGIYAAMSFYYYLLKGRQNWLYWVSIGALVIMLVMLTPPVWFSTTIAVWNTVFTVLGFPIAAWVLTLIIKRAIEGLPDARLLLVPVLLQILVDFSESLLTSASIAGLYRGSMGWFNSMSSWPFSFSLGDFMDALFMLAMLAILVRRFTRTSMQQETYQRELEAARTVQQVLIPEDLPTIPGFSIASVYNPATEVGGDFFQILPAPGGAVLMVIGDVSGKGMQAAMMVSLLVGALRTLVETTVRPAELLSGLNRRLHGRSGDGFTTCLALRADADGSLTVANAGHLSPYRNGEELPVEGGLPLGIVADAAYEEARFHLAAGDILTLLTDGVVEARDHEGTLFGFDRTAQISTQAAAAIASAARQFGQDDDITVLTLTRTPAFAV